MQQELFAPPSQRIELAPGAAILGNFAVGQADLLLGEVANLQQSSPFRQLMTPGGRTMSVAMLNCGALGWVSDRRGYRYEATDPLTGKPWPKIPPTFFALAARAASAVGFADFVPDACLVNRYVPGAKMGLHQDVDERDQRAPIVSVSLGLSARFLWGGRERSEGVRRFWLTHGDVVVWGGPSRLYFHGVDALPHGIHPRAGPVRYNLTFRTVV